MTALDAIKNWFRNGKKPDQQQFWDTWDSFYHKSETIPVTSIENLDGRFDDKADAETFQNHVNDSAAHGIDQKISDALLGFAVINDAVISENETWSSSQISRNMGVNGAFEIEDDGQSIINIPHGLGAIPSYWIIKGKDKASKNVVNVSNESVDETNIILTPDFMNNDGTNLTFLWEAKL